MKNIISYFAYIGCRRPIKPNINKGTAMEDFIPQENIKGISHLNVVVDDIDKAAEFYRSVLGFKEAANNDGPMDYRNVESDSFARNAGFSDGKVKVDIKFLKHPAVGVFLELMRYHHPRGEHEIQLKNVNDMGGVRHIALSVDDANRAYEFISMKKKIYFSRGLNIKIVGRGHPPEQLNPHPYKFFYWIDPWGIQWEMEEGRSTDLIIRGVVG